MSPNPKCALAVCLLGLALGAGAQNAVDAVVLMEKPERNLQTGMLENYEPVNGKQRVGWYLRESAGAAMSGAVFSAAMTSAFQTPREWPRTWEYTGKRWALSASGAALANGFEAGLGAIWGEDPRYYRVNAPMQGNFGAKLKNAMLSTVTATNREGKRMPAYSRYAGQVGSNLLQMEWRPESQSSVGDAFVRVGYGFLGRMSGNIFREFWPDIRSMISRKKQPKP